MLHYKRQRPALKLFEILSFKLYKKKRGGASQNPQNHREKYFLIVL